MRRSILTAFIRLICFLVFSFIFSLGLPAMADAASDLPDGFIALSEPGISWDKAKAYCQQHGGRLPLIDDSESRGDDYRTGPRGVDGFGLINKTPWPAGLDAEYDYWTGTAYVRIKKGKPTGGNVWVVHKGATKDRVEIGHRNPAGDIRKRALCVP